MICVSAVPRPRGFLRISWQHSPAPAASVLNKIKAAVVATIIIGHAADAADIRPNPKLTPGDVRTANPAETCGVDTRTLRHWSRERDNEVLIRYGLPPGPHPDFEVDHLIPLCLGGSDDPANLWPQPRRTIELRWNAEAKDRLEVRLCEMVCAGEIEADDAQIAIGVDWIAAYGRFVGEH